MLRWTITFITLAFVFALLGFSGMAGSMSIVAKIMFPVCIILFIISLIKHIIRET